MLFYFFVVCAKERVRKSTFSTATAAIIHDDFSSGFLCLRMLKVLAGEAGVLYIWKYIK